MRLSKWKFLIFTAFWGFPLLLSAQKIVVNGVVFDNRTSFRIANATITNKASGVFVKSNDLGIFQIQVELSDTLSIMKKGYTEYFLRISSDKDLLVRLQQVIALSEVTVTGQTKKQELNEIRKEFKKKSHYAGKPPVLAYIFHPITALYETFGKEPGMARRFNSFYRTELEDTEINRRFNTPLIKELTHFEGKDLQNFMDIYKPQYEILDGWDDYQLIKYIKVSADTFNKNGRPPGSLKALPKLPPAPDLSDKKIKVKKIKRIKI